MTRSPLIATIAVLLAACSDPNAEFHREVNGYLSSYEREFQRLYTAMQEADWATNTRIVRGDTTNAARAVAAGQAYAAFVGSVENIERIRGYLAERERLRPVQVRQLEVMLHIAADQPQTEPELVRARLAAETEQVERLYGYRYTLRGRPITFGELNEMIRTEEWLPVRRAAWISAKEVGPSLRQGILRLRDLRNRTVQALGYPDFFTYQVAEYDMTTDEMLSLMERLVEQLRPLYRELHTWARHELAQRNDAPVFDLIPTHWLPNLWAQDWSGLVEVPGANIDSALALHDAEWVMQQGEAFYMSLGFPEMPSSFWELSSLYPLPPSARYAKNTHASAWHMDRADDVRSLMSVEPNANWYGTVHHELGHVYYYMSYSNRDVPLVLRRGANRAYHEAIGTLMGFAAGQRRCLTGRELLAAGAGADTIQLLLKEALQYVAFIPFAAGVMTRFEHGLYAGSLEGPEFNPAWWRLAERYQGITSPGERSGRWADALTKTHVNDDPAQYYDYAIANVLLFQLHDHIAREILDQDPHDTDYYGNERVGRFLRDLMAPGATRPWREVLRETTGRDLDAQAMLDYFAPLQAWLEAENRGRTHTLPELCGPAGVTPDGNCAVAPLP